VCKCVIPAGQARLGTYFKQHGHESCHWRCFPDCMTRTIAEHVAMDIRGHEPIRLQGSATETAYFIEALEEMLQPSYQFRIKRRMPSAAARPSVRQSAPGGQGNQSLRQALNQVNWLQLQASGTLASVTVHVLKEYLRVNSLPVSGSKQELVVRVDEHIDRVKPRPIQGFVEGVLALCKGH
jgi:hypothetical protein